MLVVTTPRSRWANSNFVQASIVMPIISPAYLWRGEIQGCAIALCRIGDIGRRGSIAFVTISVVDKMITCTSSPILPPCFQPVRDFDMLADRRKPPP